ncbi:MAG: BatD family protein [Prevotella sp.]|nr:BatD family protein [Prevotella sp.]
MKRYLLITCVLLSWVMFTQAQSLVANAPTNVAVGENFRVTYTLNTQNASDFHVGSVPEALEIITGPYTSSQSSFQMVNGHTSSSSSITYTFILCASKAGTYTITPASVTVGGKKVVSKPVKITASGESASKNGAPKMHDDSEVGARVNDAGTPIKGSDLFIQVTANKKHVHEQEPILLTYKVYTLVDLTQLEGKMPDLTGFHTQEIPLPQQKSFHIENVNGRAYRCVTWSQYVMYPQMTGKLEIPSITFKGTVVQQNRNVDPFEAFLNGGSGYIEVKRDIKAPGMTIQVDPLPTRPANFSGGVGKFNITAQIDKSEVKANDPVTIRVIVGGVGNLKLIKQPVIEFPKDFDKYDAKVTDKTKLTTNGVEGNMVYDFLAVPRNQGKYEIPAVEFTYYDTEANAYKTIKTQPFELTVTKGSGSGGTVVDYGESNSEDIHDIKEGVLNVQDIDNILYGSPRYWTALVVLLVVFVTLLIIFRKRAIDNANVGRMKVKKANRVATKRLKFAHKLLMANQKDKFYDEVLRALWGYVGDKLNIPVTQLSKENISEKLMERDVDEETVALFIQALDECEYNRYAPGDPQGNMNQTFEAAMTAIIKIEDMLKSLKKRHNSVKTMLLLVLLVLMAAPTNAVTKKNADDEYKKGNYQQAIKDYEELLKAGPCARTYYNLGNAYYRTDNITRAVLNYERALLLSPGDDDIRFNLQMARSKTIDKITPKSEMFFVTWYKTLVNLAGVDSWARIAIFSFAIALILLLIYLFVQKMTLRKVGFYGAMVFLIIFILSNIFAYEQKRILTRRTGAIIMAPSAALKKTPVANSDYTAIIHEGSRVEIIDDTMKDWKQVQLADGRDGWVEVSQLERI